MKQTRKSSTRTLFKVERRVVIGEVEDGGTMHPVAAGMSIIAEELSGTFDRIHRPITDLDPVDDNDTGYVWDTLSFQWGGHTFNVEVRPDHD